jgi:hypothetical protein
MSTDVSEERAVSIYRIEDAGSTVQRNVGKLLWEHSVTLQKAVLSLWELRFPLKLFWFSGEMSFSIDSNIANELSLQKIKKKEQKQNNNKNELDVDIVLLRWYFMSNVIQRCVFMHV